MGNVKKPDELGRKMLDGKAGDPKSFNKAATSIMEHARKLVGSNPMPDHLKDQVLSNINLKTHRIIASYDGRNPGTTWLSRIVNNAIIDTLRTNKNHLGRADANYEPFVEYEQDWLLRDKINSALELLKKTDPKCHQTFKLVHIDGLTEAAAARQLGKGQSTIYYRLGRAKKKLRSILEAKGVTPATNPLKRIRF